MKHILMGFLAQRQPPSCSFTNERSKEEIDLITSDSSLYGRVDELLDMPDPAIWQGPYYPEIWYDLSKLRASLTSMTATRVIQIELCLDAISEAQLKWCQQRDGSLFTGPHLFTDRVREFARDVEIRGYDVADGSFVSGILNMGIHIQRTGPLFWSVFGDKINKFGLFQTAEDGFRFAGIANLEVPEHAPFYVFRLSECFL